MKLILTLSLFLHHLLVSSCTEKQVFVVYFGEHRGNKTSHEIEEAHHSYLWSIKHSKEEAKASLIYSYKHSINGFAALLTADEASILSELDEVISVFESRPKKYSLQTTRSWEFLRTLEDVMDVKKHNISKSSSGSRDMLLKSSYGKDMIVGIMDTGIWPESQSFDAKGMDPIPQSWKGTCREGDIDFNYDPFCTRKIIGARYYYRAFEEYYGTLNLLENSLSACDLNGHGTHIASIMAGRNVKDIDALGGFAFGNASGGSPMSRLAIYKVCWRVPNMPLARCSDCLLADMFAAFDDAIEDGVHVMSISIASFPPFHYDSDEISIGAFHAMKNDIVVVCAAGNNGPYMTTVSNVAPWILTVGASSIDRIFGATLTLGDYTKIYGQSITPSKLTGMYPLVYAGDAEVLGVPENLKGQCTPGSLSRKLVKGKIVLCIGNVLESKVGTSEEVKRVKGVGIIIGDNQHMGEELSLDTHRLPAILLASSDATMVFDYIRDTLNPMASIGFADTVQSNRPAPSILSVSSRGPSMIDPHILKPDLVAPGLNILAAWSKLSSPTLLMDDHRVVEYNIVSGTSIAAPHVASMALVLKAIHPNWSNAAIRSALITSASVINNMGSFITDYNGNDATPIVFGSGHLNPAKAADPGLVYDATYIDYLTYLCNVGLTYLASSLDPTFTCPQVVTPSYNLNYPSISITNVTSTVKVLRTVTNVGHPKSEYQFIATPPSGFIIKATPSYLNFDYVGQKKSFSITLTMISTSEIYSEGTYAFGWYAWSDISHYVKSHIVVCLA